MKITFFGLSKEEESIFAGPLSPADISFVEGKLDERTTEKAQGADIICLFVDSTVNKAVIDALPDLKFIATRSTGFDHIDHEYAASRGIKVSNVPAYGSHTVAEFAFGLILNLSRNIIKANNYIRETSDFNYSPAMEGFDLAGKTLGVVGTGKIGKNVVMIGRSFGMDVIAYDLHPDTAFAAEHGFTYKSLPEVVSGADILTLHAPYTKENHHLINAGNISLMKKGAYLINTARGELVDTEALVSALKEGRMGGFGGDVLEGENILKNEKNPGSPPPGEQEKKVSELNHELMKMPNVIITPHIAFFTREAVNSILETSLENIKGFIGGAPVNLVK